MKKTKLMFIIISVSLMLIMGCGKKAGEKIDAGSFEGSVYSNRYFGMTATMPSGWSIQDQKVQKQIMDTGSKVVAGDDKHLQSVIKESEKQTVNLFAVFRHPIGSPVRFNTNIISVAERVSHISAIKNGKDYLANVKKLLESTSIRVSYPSEMSTENIGGHDFDVMHVKMGIAGNSVYQDYYVLIKKGYALAFITSFSNNEEKAILQDFLDTVTIK